MKPYRNEGDLVQKVVAYVRQKLQPIIDKVLTNEPHVSPEYCATVDFV